MIPPKANGVPDSRKCMVCGKPCEIWDRNIDKTYAHRECLYANMTLSFRQLRAT